MGKSILFSSLSFPNSGDNLTRVGCATCWKTQRNGLEWLKPRFPSSALYSDGFIAARIRSHTISSGWSRCMRYADPQSGRVAELDSKTADGVLYDAVRYMGRGQCWGWTGDKKKNSKPPASFAMREIRYFLWKPTCYWIQIMLSDMPFVYSRKNLETSEKRNEFHESARPNVCLLRAKPNNVIMYRMFWKTFMLW